VKAFPVRFADGKAVAGYVPPANTVDPRARACTSHHLGCDCREATVQEDMRELAADRDEWRAFAIRLLSEIGEDRVAKIMIAQLRFERQTVATFANEGRGPDGTVPF
jgi:hypothetical protein